MADLPAIDRIASGGTVIDEPDASPPSVLDINATFGDEIIDKSEFIAEVHKSHALAMRARSHFPASPLSAVASKYEGGIDDTNAIFDARTSDQNKIEILMQPNIDSLFGDEYLTALTAPPPKALSDPSETLDGDATTTTAFEGEESTEAKNILSIVDDIFGSMPHELEELLRTNGQVAALPLARRRKRVRERLLTSSVGIVSNIRRAMKHLLKYLKENDLPFTCFANDVLIDSVEEYGDGAKTRAAQRKANATKHGKTLKRDRGGATARMPIVNGYANMSKLMGLPIEVSEELKDVARCGPGMPTVATMTSARAVRNYELKTMAKTGSAKNSKYVRAYAGGGCIKVYSSTRTKDLQRTPLISFEKSTVLGSDALIACGIARKSKAPAQKQMRPLAWRAPVISISGEDIDLQPLLESMPDSTDGCVFRDFITPPGVPHSIIHAIEWCNRPASHETIVRSLRDIGEDDEIDGHSDRHFVPECARGLRMPRHLREPIGYWAAEKVVADSTEDQAAYARAVTLARKRKTRMSAIASCADRYSSKDAAPVEQDDTRATCLIAMRDQMAIWGEDVPVSTRDQIAAIMSAADGHSKKKKKK